MITQMKEQTLEEITLRYSKRGMNELKPHLSTDFCRKVAEKLLQLPKGSAIFLTTGFYVGGHAETDGPPGTYVAARALQLLGYRPIIVTDSYCEHLFDCIDVEVVYVPFTADNSFFSNLIDQYKPACLISIERCGRNIDGEYANMRGVSIRKQTAPIDLMFLLAKQKKILTIGVGDGGNEIGMGNLSSIITEKLALKPCIIPVDELIIATVSNWGAYCMVAYLQLLSNEELLPSFEVIKDYLSYIISYGCVDGVTKENVTTVDGFPLSISEEIINSLHSAMKVPILT